MADMFVKWEVVCDACGHKQRHMVPFAEQARATCTCPECGPLDVERGRGFTWGPSGKLEGWHRHEARLLARGWRTMRGHPRPSG